MAIITYADVSWERMSNAVEKVRQRLLRAASALRQAGVPYAVAGGNTCF
jgi:predicted RNA polymerase sigma factor